MVERGVIYDSVLDHLISQLAQYQRLQEEGINVGSMPEQTWNRILNVIEARDNVKLDNLRKELKETNARVPKPL